nr:MULTISPECIES: restriction endonuclease subunit S [unclassified Actinopolyspora]
MPEHWQWSQLRHVTKVVRRGTSPDYVDESSVRVVNQACVQDSGLDWSKVKYHQHEGDPKSLKGYLFTGDVLVNSTGTGTLGRVGYFTPEYEDGHSIADGHVTVVRADGVQSDSRYLYHYLRCAQFQHYVMSALVSGSTNQIELNAERLASAPVPLPPLEEQRRIADFLDAETARIDQISAMRSRQSQLAWDRHLAYISELVTPGITSEGSKSVRWPWLPSGIATARLSYFVSIQNGVTVDASRDTSDSVEVPYLRVANVRDGTIDLSEVATIEVEESLAFRSRLRIGDVVMTEANGNVDNLVLQRHSEWVSALSVVAVSGLVLASAAPA